MTVILIDISGHRRQFEIHRKLPEIFLNIPQRLSAQMLTGPVEMARYPRARCVLTAEESWPPVYRMVQ